MNAKLASGGFNLDTENPGFLIRTTHAEKYKEVYKRAYGKIEFHRGRLTISFLDPDSREVIWEGVAKAYLSEESKPSDIKAGISKGVENLLRDFPPVIREQQKTLLRARYPV